MSRCVKCGIILYEERWKNGKKLWCDKCREEVDKELNHVQNKPYKYYFEWYQKRILKK